jgi:hypothetical protein
VGAPGMFARFVLIPAGRECCRQVDPKRGLSADEGSVETVEGVGEDPHGVGVSEAGEGVAAPAGEVHGVERHVGLLVGRIIW